MLFGLVASLFALFWIQILLAISACNFCLQFLLAISACNFCLQFLLAISACKFYLQILLVFKILKKNQKFLKIFNFFEILWFFSFFFSNFSFLENSNLMAGSGFKKFLRLVVCKTSFYLFLQSILQEQADKRTLSTTSPCHFCFQFLLAFLLEIFACKFQLQFY